MEQPNLDNFSLLGRVYWVKLSEQLVRPRLSKIYFRPTGKTSFVKDSGRNQNPQLSPTTSRRV